MLSEAGSPSNERTTLISKVRKRSLGSEVCEQKYESKILKSEVWELT
jgi:hypothetical protein